MRFGISFLRGRSGATAVEFALVAPLFFAILFSTFEAGWTMTRGLMLDRALDQSIRLVRIGGANAPKTQAALKAEICKRAFVITNCVASTTVEMVEIKTAADFPTTAAVCVDQGQNIVPVVSLIPGSRSSIVFVRVCVFMEAFTPLLGLALELPVDAKGRYRQIASSAFMNEPAT